MVVLVMTLLDQLTNKWKTASGGKKILWLAIALFAVYFIYQFKKNWDKMRAERKK
jgi:hypothetical protein